MNIIIVGCGKVGQKLAEQLSQEEHNITVIDILDKSVQTLTNQFDVMGVIGSGTNTGVLHDADIQDADLLIAVTGTDEINLLSCFIARKMSDHCETIARVRKPEYSKEWSIFKKDLGLAMIINPDKAAANETVRALSFPSAISVDTFAKGKVEILKFKVKADCPLVNSKVSDIRQKHNCDILVCGIERGDKAFIPSGDFVICEGDYISIIASIKNASSFFKKINLKTNKVKDTIIVGGGPISYYLAKRLLETGVKVKIIEQKPEKCNRLCETIPNATIINGDGTDTELLLEEGIDKADSFVALTNIDEENVMLSLYAKSIMNGKVVTKINKITYDDVIKNLDLDTTVYPKNITAEYIVKFVRAKMNTIEGNIETMHLILNGKAEALEFMIKENSPIAHKAIMDLQLKDNVLIACISRKGKVIIPSGQDTLEVGDSVVVVTTNSGFLNIRDIFK